MTEKDIKPNLNRLVVHSKSGMRYRLTGATIRLNDMGEYWYQAELQDLTALSSVRICKLCDPEVISP